MSITADYHLHSEHSGDSTAPMETQILSGIEKKCPDYKGMEDVCAAKQTYLRIFGKPDAHVGRRMGVVVCWDKLGESQDALRDKCKGLAAKVTVC